MLSNVYKTKYVDIRQVMEGDNISLLRNDSILKYVKMVSNPLNMKPTTKEEYEFVHDDQSSVPVLSTPMKGTSEHNVYAPRKRKAMNYTLLDDETADNNAREHDIKRPNIESRVQPMRKAKQNVVYIEKNGEDYITELGNKVDADLIREIFDVEEVEKDDFVDKSRREIGFIIEDYLAEHLPCPYCGNKTLRSYVRKNMATVDLICISDDHDVEKWPIFFQVKASHIPEVHPYKDMVHDVNQVISGSIVRGYPYFTLNNSRNTDIKNSILTGSFREGNIIHRINIDSDKNEKMLLMAYICVGYRDTDYGYEILPDKSFTVLPDKKSVSGRHLFHSPSNSDNYYFRVLEQDGGKTLIEFSRKNNVIGTVPHFIVPFNYKGIWTYGKNPRRVISLR